MSPARSYRPGDTATLAEILAAKLAENHAAQFAQPVAIQRYAATHNRAPRHWRINPQTRRLEEVRP